MEHYRGIIEKIIFQKSDGGTSFYILAVRSQENGRISVKGSAPTPLREEMKVTFSGEMSEYEGRPQVDAIRVSPDVPITARGARGWVMTEPVDDFGPKSAQKVIDAYPDTLHEVLTDVEAIVSAGIRKTVADDLASAWGSLTIPNDILEMFGVEGVPHSVIKKIFDEYGASLTKQLERDPWAIARHVSGVGFKMMDAIAQSLGADMEADERYLAMLDYVMSAELANAGHTQVKRAYIVARARSLGFTDGERVEKAIDAALGEGGPLVLDTETDRISHRTLYQDEQAIRKNIQRLMKASRAHDTDREEYLARIKKAEEDLGITLDQSQRDAALKSLENGVSIITGGPGTGKSTTQAVILKALGMDKGETVDLTAPTGRAAKRLGEATNSEGMTIHRLLAYDPIEGGFVHCQSNPLEATTIIADEYSMVDTHICRSLLDAVADRARVIIVGDDNQLPSVGQGQVLADLIRSEVVPLSRLEVVHRQAEQSGIITAAHAILKGEMPEFNDRDTFFWDADTTEAIHEKIIALYDMLAERGIADPNDIMVLSPQRKGENGSNRLNEVIKDHLNPADPEDPDHTLVANKTEWSVGDRVMQYKNCYDKEVFNGEIGTIVAVAPGVKSSNRLWVQYPERTESIEYKDGEFRQLGHAWASTIHKVQGSEAPVTLILTTKAHEFMLERCLVYTGETRPKEECHFIGQKGALKTAIAKTRASLRRAGLMAGLRADAGLEPILWKNTRSQAQNIDCRTRGVRLSCQAFRGCCGAGRILASLRRFWAVAARRNSSFAPRGPRNRSLFRPRIRLRWAKSISTFFLSFIEITYCSVLAISRATSRASSCSSRVILRASAFGQHFAFDGHA
ncbi:RecD-like DNA helicase YrrC [Salipiger mucosus DSM 16094]|uniref:RecD-like DNA helicase YrrC n=1 Tax=Salipiger mucosus DSM 16094 TaxID=1123237 RepID=S9QWJ1_9RHOB|nr:RecD-like DNA helicase YrrC [Salipiger mucosus DSM 16094]